MTGIAAALVAFQVQPSASHTVLRIQRLSPLGPGEWRELENFQRNLATGTQGGLAIEFDGPVGGTADILRAIADGRYDGLLGQPWGLSNYDLGFSILGNTVRAFDDIDDRDIWFARDEVRRVAENLYAGLDLHLVGEICTSPQYIVANCPLNSITELRGVQIVLSDDLCSDVLQRAGVLSANPPATLRGADAIPGVRVDGYLVSEYGPYGFVLNGDPSTVFLDVICSMPLRFFALSRRSWDAMSSHDQAFLRAELRELASSFNRKVGEARLALRDLLRARGVATTVWPRVEHLKLRQYTAEVLDTLHGRSSAATQLVESIKRYQRENAP